MSRSISRRCGSPGCDEDEDEGGDDEDEDEGVDEGEDDERGEGGGKEGAESGL